MKVMKKPLSLILALAVLITAFAGLRLTSKTASAATVKVWDGTADTSWFTRDDLKDVYEIYTAEQLAGLAYLCDHASTEGHPDRFRGVIINLMNDIELNDTANWQNWVNTPPANKWEPIGMVGDPLTGYDPFAGIFNGNGHTISGMYCKSDRNWWGWWSKVGLFDYICGATIGNLKIEKSVVLGGEDSDTAVLAAQSENSYIDSVEISDCIIGKGSSVGAIAGSCKVETNLTTLFGYIAITAATGMFFNPLMFLNSSGNPIADPTAEFGGTVINNCKVSNLDVIHTGRTYYDSYVGAMAGRMSGGAVFNSISENVTIDLDETRKDLAGAMYALKIDDKPVTVENCYTHNFVTVDGQPQQDANVVKTLSKSEYLSSDLVKKLGNGFESVKNGTPIIASLKDATLNQKIVPGDFNNSGKLEIGDVTATLKAVVYDMALDYRTFKAADMDGSGTLNINDITAMLKKMVNG